MRKLMHHIFDGAGGEPDLVISLEPQEPGIPAGCPVAWDENRGMWVRDDVTAVQNGGEAVLEDR